LPSLKPLEELDFPFLLVFFACAVTFLVDVVVVAVRRTLAPHVLRNISIDFTLTHPQFFLIFRVQPGNLAFQYPTPYCSRLLCESFRSLPAYDSFCTAGRIPLVS